MRTNAGSDWQAQQMGASSGLSTNGANFLGLTADATAPAATDTVLVGEIATPGGGLVRKQATYAHTAGAAQYTLTATFTANASDALPVSPIKLGSFTLGAGGVLVFSSLLINAATLGATGDAVTITEQVSI